MKEIRRTTLTRATQLSLRTSNNKRTLQGYALVFNRPSEDMGFIETISPQAVQLSRYPNVFALRGHDTNRQLASTASKTLTLTKDSTGVHFSFDLPNTQDGNDLAELYRLGGQKLAGQCSFGFTTNRDDYYAVGDTIHRTLLDIDVMEISVGVVQPAYTDTTAALRRMPKHLRKPHDDFAQRVLLLNLLGRRQQ